MHDKIAMGKKLAAQVGQYKKHALLSPLCTIGCVILEILIPYLTASIIDNGIAVGDMGHVARVGALMAVMALVAMFFGVTANRLSAKARTGFAANLRSAMFENIQRFSFANIEKFSTAGLVTRLTTDVGHVQMSLQMILMVCTRAPSPLIIALVMALSISARLSIPSSSKWSNALFKATRSMWKSPVGSRRSLSSYQHSAISRTFGRSSSVMGLTTALGYRLRNLFRALRFF